MFFSNFSSNCSNSVDLRNLQEQVKNGFCYQKLFWPFTVWTNYSSVLKIFANSLPSALNFKSFSQSLEQSFLTVGQNNFGNKIPFLLWEPFKGFFAWITFWDLIRTLLHNFLLVRFGINAKKSKKGYEKNNT